MPLDSNLFFLLKGDHPTLPEAEVKSIFEAEEYPYITKPGAPQILRCRAEPDAGRAVTERAYYTRLCVEEFFASKNEPSAILSAFRDIDFTNHLKHGERFKVILRRVRRSAIDVELRRLMHRLGRLIQNQTKAELKLKSPDVNFIGVFSGGGFYFGRIIAESERRLGERRAGLRPFFHPSTLQPKLAGCMVNLARVRPPQTLLDPFCGAGAILIEAAHLGCRPQGLDISASMVEGSRQNLFHFGVDVFDLMVGDARRLPLYEVGAVATDPPYGRISSTRGSDVEQLYREFLHGIAERLRSGSHLCLAAPHALQATDLAGDAGFKQNESHLIHVHDNLTREVSVFRRM